MPQSSLCISGKHQALQATKHKR